MIAIKNKRLELEFTQEQLSKYSGVSRSMIRDVETGRRNPSFSILFKLVTALNKKCVNSR